MKEIAVLLVHDDESVRDAATRINDQLQRRHRILELVQEAIGQLRLDMKYLLFDVEATRRERDYFQAMVNGVPTLPAMGKVEAKRILQHTLDHGSRGFTQLQILGACEMLK